MEHNWQLRTWRHLACLCYLPRATPNQIAQVESLLGRALPEQVAQFLMEFNGGWLEYNFTWRGAMEVTFPQVVPVDAEWLGERMKRRAPRRLLEIASGASQLLLDMDQDVPPLLFIPARFSSSQYLNEAECAVLAPTFDEYIEGLWLELDDHFEVLCRNIESGKGDEAAALRAFLDAASPGWQQPWAAFCERRSHGDDRAR